MEVEHLKNLGASLVREYLFRMGLKRTLKCMDDEFPRSPESFNNRMLLARELKIEHLVHEYKQVNCPAKSVLEIMIDEFVRNNGCVTSPKTRYAATSALARVSFEKWSRKVSVQRSKTIDSNRMVWFYRQLSDRGVKIDFPTLVHIYCDCFGCDRQAGVFRETEERRLQVSVFDKPTRGRHKSGERDEHRDYKDPREEYDETIQEAMVFNRLNPRKYPAQRKNAVRDKEEILLDSLSTFRCRTSYDNRTRLGPNKEDTFQNLKRSRSAGAVAQLIATAPSDPPAEPICDIALRTSQPDSLTETDNLKCSVSVESTILPETRINSNENKEPGLVSDPVDRRVVEKEISILTSENVSVDTIEKRNVAVNELGDVINTMSLPSLDDEEFQMAMHDVGPLVIQISSPKITRKSYNINRNREECRVYTMYNNNNGNQNKLDDIEDAADDETEVGDILEFIPMRLSQAIMLKKLILGSAIRSFPLQWMLQSFILNSNPKLQYGFVQNKGGACGVLASVQAHLLKWLLFQPQTAVAPGDCDPLRPTRQEVRQALAPALADILWRAGDSKQAVLVRSNQESHLEENLVYRPDGLTDSLLWRRFHNEKDLQEAVESHLDEFTSPLGKGCLRFVISAILSCGIQSVLGDMDDASSALLCPGTGTCSLELVTLLVTGRAVSNVFDNDVRLDATCLLRGIAKRSDIGFLSIFEHFNSCQVGTNLKTPRYPIWLVNSDNHFSVVFSPVKQLVSDWRAERQFHLYHYDGLASSHQETVLTIDTTGFSGNDGAKKDNVPALELCIKTKWKDAIVHWSSNVS